MKNKSNKTTWGTSHFVDFASALRYYQKQEFGVMAGDVKQKIKEGLISIGLPNTKAGQSVSINYSEGRYFITG